MLADAKPLPVGWRLIHTLLDYLSVNATHQTCNAVTGPSECQLCMPAEELCFDRQVQHTVIKTFMPIVCCCMLVSFLTTSIA